MTAVDRDVSRRGRTARLIRGRVIPWLIVAINAASVYISYAAGGSYTRYADSLGNDCGRLVSMSALTAFVMWLAFAMATGSVLLAAIWSRQRRRARGLRWFPVRGAGLALACLGAGAAAWCFVNVWFQPGPYHVFCSNI